MTKTIWRNTNDNTDILSPTEVVVDGVTYPKQVFNDDIKLASIGITKETVTLSAEEERLLNVPMSITMRQCRLKLNAMGILDGVETAVNTMSGDAVIEWQYATDIEIVNPLVLQVGAMLGMTQGEIDTMFIEASLL